MMKKIVKRSLGTALAVGMSLSANLAFGGKLVINSDTSDPAPKKAMQYLVSEFEKAHPDIEVKWNVFDHEGFKTSIRNFLSADAPDIVTWYAGNRMLPFVKAELFAPIDDVWDKNNFHELLASSADSSTVNGKKYAVPYSYYQWGVYYRKDIFNKHNIPVPKTWADFIQAGEVLKSKGITPITIGTKFLWTAAGVFDYINLRTNGYEFHMDLTNGKVAWTDKRVKDTMNNWKELIDREFFIKNHTTYSWQEALSPMVKGEAAMYVMGNFAVAPLREAGLNDDQIGFFQFPIINGKVSLAEEAPTETMHMPMRAKNKEEARKFLAFLGRAEVQAGMNQILGQLPINKNSEVADDPFIKAGFQMLSNTKGGIAQFFDRDAPANMAKPAMEGFQQFMVKPERVDGILKKLDKARKRVY